MSDNVKYSEAMDKLSANKRAAFRASLLAAEECSLCFLRGELEARPAIGPEDRAQRVSQCAHDLPGAARLREHAARNGAQPDAQQTQAVRAVRLGAYK